MTNKAIVGNNNIENTNDKIDEIIDLKTKKQYELSMSELIIVVVLSLFFVIFLWGFWSNGIYALGFNASIFGFLFFGFFLLGIKETKVFIKKNLYWLLPIIFITLSFSIYENPFLKKINLFLLPLITTFFISLSLVKIEGLKTWTLKSIKKITGKKILLGRARKAIVQNINYGNNTQVIIKKIIIGIIVFISLNSIIIGLLSGADSKFSELISSLTDFINFESLIRIVFFFVLLLLFIAYKLSWKEELIIKNEVYIKKMDSIVSGIVLGGTLLTYLLFIGVQIENIFASSLPGNINEIANIVKNGFWQLFFVSIINIILFFVYYKKTSNIVQNILIAFILASIIILISAGNKMYMYVFEFGFSYEKFFASYTVLYFGILFISMIIILFSKLKIDILKISIILALWMYSALNIIPTEIIIFETNTAISMREESSIQKYQSHMLSIDIIKSVEKLKGNKLYKEQNWDQWINKKIKKNDNKKWYEKNIKNF